MRGLAAWRRRQAAIEGRASIGDTLTEMVRVALAIPEAAPHWLSQCSYYACRSRRADLLLSMLSDIDPDDRKAVQRAAEALWDALEHSPVTYDRAIGS